MPRAYHTPQKATDPAEKACPERYARRRKGAIWNSSRRVTVKFGAIRQSDLRGPSSGAADDNRERRSNWTRSAISVIAAQARLCARHVVDGIQHGVIDGPRAGVQEARQAIKVLDGYVAYIEELPGANTQGTTMDEARENLREAVQLVREGNRELSREELGQGEVIREELRLAVG